MSVPRSQSVPHFASFQITKISTASSSTGVAERHARPQLPRHRSAVGIAGHSHHPVSVYTPRVEREDPFSLSGFFPASLAAREYSDSEQGWDWLRAATEDEADAEELQTYYRSGPVSPISESDSEWNIPTPCSPDMEDALAGDAIKREDKLGILALSDTLFLPPRGDELYVEERLLSPYLQPGDPLDADAVYDALRALRTAHSVPYGSGVKDESAALHSLFSPEKEVEDKVKVEADGWEALVSWGVSTVVDYISPV
ncbi:hypothetical protein L227DRAFT_270845 [Lentinus tigrinus ALCF2SS1-6]|uniref:Uncharacterized protein n=1 Tax=Lentinus tigrinus ALCF2SS1-6 TaxID=1328759 RepID=A0A5C2SM78_9APHY|nr:hypothetical protein L227DRAFT_270845 [Lentinus tigrinus ALCF2SS1-6]